MNLPYRVVCTGPESCGKTVLAQQLAAHFNCPWVPEYARIFLETLDRPYELNDLKDIAKGQEALEAEYAAQAKDLLLCDTDLLTILVWGEYKFGYRDPQIESQFVRSGTGLYLLCLPDLPWQDDPMREHPEERGPLLKLYEGHLIRNGKAYVRIGGIGERRKEAAIKAILMTQK